MIYFTYMNSYNIHPIIVHFPIAFLFIYSIIKILPLSKWFPGISWKQIERLLLVVGVLGAFAAFATGDTAKHLMHPNRQLVSMHENFAALSVWIYGLLLLGEIISVFNQNYRGRFSLNEKIVKILSFLETILCNNVFSKILAFAGFIAIFLTGLLGGAMVYGATADPIAGIVLKLLGISI